MKTILQFFQFFLIFLLISQSVNAGILDYRGELERICTPNESIVTKKILLSLANFQNVSDDSTCSPHLEILIKKCTTKITCRDLIVSFSKFSNGTSSVLIGE